MKYEKVKFYTGPVKQDRILRHGDLVVANTDLTQTRDILGRPLRVPFDGMTSTHHTFQLDVVGGDAERVWVYFCLRFEPYRRQLAAYGTGTTVAALPKDALLGLAVPWPDWQTLERWHEATQSLLDAEKALHIESEHLKVVRNELLSLLVSGRVVVRGAVV